LVTVVESAANVFCPCINHNVLEVEFIDFYHLTVETCNVFSSVNLIYTQKYLIVLDKVKDLDVPINGCYVL
jgi:hypothetical protein